MLGLKLNHVSKRGYWRLLVVYLQSHIPEMCLSSELLWEHWIELVAMELHCIRIKFSARIFWGIPQALWAVAIVVFDAME